MSGVSIRSVNKAFGATRVLRGVTLDIGDSEFMTLLGPSGCGKSTLLRIVAGLEAQDSGSIAIGGRPVDALRPRERDVAMVFQSYALYPHMTAAENIALPLVMRRSRVWQRLPVLRRALPSARRIRRDIAGEVGRVAAALDIGYLLERKPSQLSGGQRQRVALARAMVRQPRAFLMDEPLSNLDAKLRVQARAEIAELHRRLGTTFIYVTHDQAEAMTMSDRVAVMLDGEVLQCAPPATIYDDPADLRVAEFVGSPKINVITGAVGSTGQVEIAGTTLPLTVRRAPATALAVAFRAEHADVTPCTAEQQGALVGTVRHRENLGSDLFVYVEPQPASARLAVRLAASRTDDIRVGMRVAIRPDAARVLLFDRDGGRVRAA
ncbi:ABC transporter ATP-binding protein [Reyranella sp. CPCC 100927]|uniref:ABC transporter ATP-binding protein n=1 Tax=Reyranella sp. CPCC 100927 TaxID=2599616 RepID=UPI0011B45BB7|nr:ABC transporter ATP-binding protein [Reyranella sp. CPCC 100927]TWT04096.1 ABC transporter ATP-binding protein [Reyranella sp. CPCC 100927]